MCRRLTAAAPGWWLNVKIFVVLAPKILEVRAERINYLIGKRANALVINFAVLVGQCFGYILHNVVDLSC